MKYFIVKYTEDIPEKFVGQTSGPLIKIRHQYINDKGLLEHEKAHVRQWYAMLALGLGFCSLLTLLITPTCWPLFGVAPSMHQLLYRLIRPYRRWCEVQAYRKQISVGGYARNDFAVNALVEKYDLNLSVNEAKALLFD